MACFDLFNPAFEKTQAVRAISHRVEEEVFHLLTFLKIHPEISRERNCGDRFEDWRMK